MQPSLLKAEYTWFPQLFLVHFVPLLPGPLTLPLFICLSPFFPTGELKLVTLCQMWLHKHRIEKNNHLPQPAASAVTNAARCLLCLALTHAVAHSWLTFSSMYIKTSRSSYIKLVSSQTVPSLYCYMVSLFTRCRTSRFNSWTSWCSCHPDSCSCLPGWRQPCPPAYQLLPVYKIIAGNNTKEMTVSLMALYKLRMQQDWQLCYTQPSTRKHSVLLSFMR